MPHGDAASSSYAALVIKRSSATEVMRLLSEVASSDEVRREAAAARLAVIGPRAVDRVVGALDQATDASLRVVLFEVLEAIGDLRALPNALRSLEADIDAVALAALPVVRLGIASEDAGVATLALDAATRVALDAARPEALRLGVLDALADLGPAVVDPLRRALERDPSERIRGRLALPAATGALPPPAAAGPPLGRWADTGLPDDPETVRTAVLAHGLEAPLPTLHHLLSRLRDAESKADTEDRRGQWLAARAAVHQVLAERDSRVALYDLRETLETLVGPLPVAMLGAVEAFGDPSLLDAVATAWHRTDDEWTRDRLAGVLGDIIARHRLTKRHAVVKRLTARHPGLVLPAGGRTAGR